MPLSDSDITSNIKEYRRDAEDGLRDSFERMQKCQRFKKGDQWEREVLEYNKAHRRHSITVNRILPTVMQLTGAEVNNRKDIKVHNVRGGTFTVANTLTALLKHAMDGEHAMHQKSQMFEDGITTGKGWLMGWVNRWDSPRNPRLDILRPDPFTVFEDPSCHTYDLDRRGRFIQWDDWQAKDLVEARWPSKKRELTEVSYNAAGSDNTWGKIMSFLFPGTDRGYGVDDTNRSANNREKYQYRVTWSFWKEYHQGALLYRRGDELRPMRLVKPKAVREAKRLIETNPDAGFIEEVALPVLHASWSVGDVLLEHQEDPLNGVTEFPLVRYAPYFLDGYCFGIVENLIGPQEEENWAHSMVCNLLKQVANTGWKVKRLMGNYGKYLEDFGSEDGVVIEADKCGGEVDRLVPNQISTGHMVLAERAAETIQQISNVRIEDPSFDDKNLSGKAIQLKQMAAMTGSATIFSNFDYTMQLFGRLVINMMRNNEVYTPDEIRQIIDEEDLIDQELIARATKILQGAGVELGEPPSLPPTVLRQDLPQQTRAYAVNKFKEHVETFKEAEQQYNETLRQTAEKVLFADLNDKRIGEYGLKVDQSPNTPTSRIARFADLMEIEQLRPGVMPIDVLLDAADIPQKEEIIARIQQQMQAQQQAEQQAMAMQSQPKQTAQGKQKSKVA